MEVPKNIKLRLILSFEETILRKFYWFEMKENDFYWGSAYKSARFENTNMKKGDEKVVFTIPDDFDLLPKLPGKYSYHESGKTHYKSHSLDGSSNFEEHAIWKVKDKITEPVRFYATIGRTLENYSELIANPTKGKSNALILKFPSNSASKRVYFEFFLSPIGTFPTPETLLKFDAGNMEMTTHTMSDNLVLIIRYGVMSNVNDWHPDKEIAIIPDTLN
ncbi:hypothetical protein [Ferruginibacter sp.]|nr:hypothetical protein [Ferruginibacter sp.]